LILAGIEYLQHFPSLFYILKLPSNHLTTVITLVYMYFTIKVRYNTVYSIQHYVIKFASDLRQGWWFSPGTPVSSTNKTDCHDIAEILLNVTLNTTTLTHYNTYQRVHSRYVNSRFVFIYISYMCPSMFYLKAKMN
jgi:hypothetical protein